MKGRYVEIQFQDEAPRIGSGRRLVKLEVGRKWAYCTVPSTGTRARLPVAALTKLKQIDVKVRRRYQKPQKNSRAP